MPIPIANRIGQLNIPKAHAGQVFDPSESISRMGQVAANSAKLASEAMDNMGKAITLVQRQKQDLISKEATLALDQKMTELQTKLQSYEGLKAEEYRNGDFKKDAQKAILDFNKAINSVEFADIRNNAVETSRKMMVDVDANADIYVHRQNVSARKAMSDSMITYYRRQAKSAILNPDFVNIEKTMAYNTRQEVKNMANLEGLNDPTYIKLKTQEKLDEYYAEVAEEFSHLPQNGFAYAKGYLATKKKNGEMTTAAYDKKLKDIEEDDLTYQYMKNPNMFVGKKSGQIFDEELAYSIAPDLNDRERLRILHASKAASGNGGGQDVTDFAVGVAKRWAEDAPNALEKAGISDKEKLSLLYTTEDRKYYRDNMEANAKNTTFADKFKLYYENVFMPAKTNIVVRKRDTGEEVKLPSDKDDRKKQLAVYEADPYHFQIIRNMTAINDKDFDYYEKEFNKFLGLREGSGNLYNDGLSAGWFNSVEYSTMDAVAEYLHSIGLNYQSIRDVFMYMQDHKNEPFIETAPDGKTIEKSLAGFDLFEKGLYDAADKSTKTMIQTLLTKALNDPNVIARGTIESNIFKKATETDSLENYLNNLKMKGFTGIQIQEEVVRRGGFVNTLAAGWMGRGYYPF